MVQSPGPGSRRLLSAAILLALTGAAGAADPTLDIEGAPAAIPLSEVSFRPDSKLLYARTLAANYDCGTVSTPPAAGSMQLELDGNRYEIAVPVGSPPISYSSALAEFSFALSGVTTADCKSSGATLMDVVVMGADGEPTARSRIGQAVHAHLPTDLAPNPAVDLTLMDPIRCESFGLNFFGIDAHVTDPNVEATPLTGIERIEYRLPNGTSRGELRVHPQLSPSGVQRVQCTSPGFALGKGEAGAVPGRVFFSAFEALEAMADVVLTLASDRLSTDGTDKVNVVSGSDGVRLQLTVRNVSQHSASGVKLREYLRGNGDLAAMHITAGAEGATCTPIPADAVQNCPDLTGAAAFPLRLDLPTLAAGHGLSLVLHRELQVPAGTELDQVAVGYAAFVDPESGTTTMPDGMLGNNAKWVNFAVS